MRVQRRRDQLTEQLASASDHIELARIGSELADAQAELDRIEHRWLELAEQQPS
jgi:hypothetical protein